MCHITESLFIFCIFLLLHPLDDVHLLSEVLDALAVDPSLDDISAATSEANAEKNRFEDILPREY